MPSDIAVSDGLPAPTTLRANPEQHAALDAAASALFDHENPLGPRLDDVPGETGDEVRLIYCKRALAVLQGFCGAGGQLRWTISEDARP